MRKNKMDWDNLMIFLALARAGKPSLAAKELGVHHSTLYRKLEDLESTLGSQLFDRNYGKYQLSEAGLELFEDAIAMEKVAENIHARIFSSKDTLTGKLNVFYPLSLSLDPVFLKELSHYMELYPGVSLSLIASAMPNQVANIRADVRFCWTNNPDPTFGSTKLGESITAVYEAKNISANNRKNWITCYSKEFSHAPPEPDMRLLPVSDAISLLKAAEAGLGRARIPIFQAETIPSLERLDEYPHLHFLDFWMLHSKGLDRSPIFRSFSKHMVTALGKDKRFNR